MSSAGSSRPRIGLPYRTRKEELSGDFAKLEPYISALRAAGAEPVVLSLGLSAGHLDKIASTLDGAVLTGSPADVDPARFGAARHPATNDPDADRERTDWALLEHCFAEQKPVLAICYGIQSLNVFLRGSLVQDIATELTSLVHEPEDEEFAPEAFHTARIEPGSKISQMSGAAAEVRVNSSHHQSIREPGRDLHVTSRAPDGVIEAVEGTGNSHWVIGVQWHPERMATTDALAQSLFRGLIRSARKIPADA
ncbi:MAG: gamma-glutamyl-gamma-aminobutyrate hydrolase family protein [Acidobacteriota bacterium]|nr:gamma-glutamyl-gamma-aminobutyrate hydrolase family protein [Acidobacteriota bacterium]MDE3171328.1 gamma-glutamyl-gamma-aminobutyrate hydrolase family protein [Acidobacteriota bacterium]